LYNHYIVAAHILHYFDSDFAVAESSDVYPSQRHSEMAGNVLGEFRVRVSGKQSEFASVQRPTPDEA